MGEKMNDVIIIIFFSFQNIDNWNHFRQRLTFACSINAKKIQVCCYKRTSFNTYSVYFYDKRRWDGNFDNHRFKSYHTEQKSRSYLRKYNFTESKL